MTNQRLLIVDDALIIREGLAAIFHKIQAVGLVDVCEDKLEAIEAVRSGQFNVVFLELQLGQENGIVFSHELLLIDPKLKIIVYTRQNPSVMASQITRLGYQKRIQNWCIGKPEVVKAVNIKSDKAVNEVFGFMMLQNLTVPILTQKLELLHREIRTVDVEIMNLLPERFNTLHLTPRELECSKLVSQAMSNLEIAQNLGISLQAVENLINSLYNKFSIGGVPKDPGRRVLLAYTIQHYCGFESIAV